MKKTEMRMIGILFDSRTFEQFCKNGRFTISNSPIPKDATFRATNFSYERNSFIVYFEHKSFDVVPLGQVIPIKNMESNKKCTEIYYEAIQ